MKKKSVMKKLISSSFVAFLIVLSIPISANAATLTEAPEKDWTGILRSILYPGGT